jgi:hypothetical protein
MSVEDHQELEDTASRLGLPASEITRRCLRTALPILRQMNLPGTARLPRTEERSR